MHTVTCSSSPHDSDGAWCDCFWLSAESIAIGMITFIDRMPTFRDINAGQSTTSWHRARIEARFSVTQPLRSTVGESEFPNA